MQYMKLVRPLIFPVLIFISGQTSGGELKKDKYHETEVATGIIFSEHISEQNELCKRPNGCWLPQPNDIAAMEKGMAPYLLASKEPSAIEIAKNLDKYKRKYFGFKKSGDNWILVVGLCSQYWRRNGTTFQSVKRPMSDMGRCYFSVEYNVKHRNFVELYIDGEG